MYVKFNAPDLNAPRFRPESYQMLSKELHQKFMKAYPKYANVPYSLFKEIVYNINEEIWQTVIDYRDGVELPEQLGYIFIGSCPRRKRSSANYMKSIQFERLIQNRNWESDEYLAKIFYTNYETKYKFKNHDLWGFSAVRQFKRNFAKVYPKEFKKYVVVDNTTQISRLFRKIRIDNFKKKKLKATLENYNELDI